MFMAVNDTAVDDRGNVQKAIDLKARLGDPFFLEHVFADAIGKAVATIDALVASYEVAARECKVAEGSIQATKESAAKAISMAEAIHADALKAFGEAQTKLHDYLTRLSSVIKV
jgi:hypothetical protein